jgi:hypothetical protein
MTQGCATEWKALLDNKTLRDFVSTAFGDAEETLSKEEFVSWCAGNPTVVSFFAKVKEARTPTLNP